MDSSHYYHTLTIFITLIGLCYGEGVLPDTLYGAVEGNVTFTTNLNATSTPYTSIIWTVNSIDILTYRPSGIDFSPAYESRVTLNASTGSLQLRNLTMKDIGAYSVSILPAAGPGLSGRTVLQVMEKVADVSINPSSQPIIEGMSVHLTCAAAGSISTREWMKDTVPLSPSDRVSFSGDNSTVSISPVNKQDDGVYLCQVTNPVSSQDAKYNMIVNYGPDSVTIEGPLKIEVGQKLTLTCLTDSKPTANYSWMVNGTEWPGQSQVFIIENVQYKDSGTYNCTASNEITGRSQYSAYIFDLTAEGSVVIILSGGATAGIVIAVFVLVGGTGGTVYFIKKKGLFNNTSSRGRSASSPGAGYSNGGGPTEDQDVHYADVSQFHKKDGESVQLGNQAVPVESTDNPEVRVNGKPPSYTAHLQNSQTKKPAPQPGAQPGPIPSSIYSEVRKD